MRAHTIVFSRLLAAVIAVSVATACRIGDSTALPGPANPPSTPSVPTPPAPAPSPCPQIPANQSMASAFAPTGAMQTARASASLALPDGRVVVFDGPGGATPTAEVYDPATHAFSNANGMLTSRGGQQAVNLANGGVMFLHGVVLADGRTFFAESVPRIYDPASGAFTVAGTYAHPGPVTWETATLLKDGRVLLAGYAGSWDAGGDVTGATELFDPKTGTFSRTGAMKGWSDTVAWGVLLDDGTVLFVQWSFDYPLNEVERYDPSTGEFTSIGCMDNSNSYSRAVRLQDGTVLITGGQLPGGDGTADALLFLPASNTFATVAQMTVPRHSHAAALLRDGTVLIAGGYSSWPNATATAELYVPR